MRNKISSTHHSRLGARLIGKIHQLMINFVSHRVVRCQLHLHKLAQFRKTTKSTYTNFSDQIQFLIICLCVLAFNLIKFISRQSLSLRFSSRRASFLHNVFFRIIKELKAPLTMMTSVKKKISESHFFVYFYSQQVCAFITIKFHSNSISYHFTSELKAKLKYSPRTSELQTEKLQWSSERGENFQPITTTLFE